MLKGVIFNEYEVQTIILGLKTLGQLMLFKLTKDPGNVIFKGILKKLEVMLDKLETN